MSMHFVTSTLVDSIGYHNGNLYIQFKNGNLYEYFNVPFRHYQGILAAESVGKLRRYRDSGKREKKIFSGDVYLTGAGCAAGRY